MLIQKTLVDLWKTYKPKTYQGESRILPRSCAKPQEPSIYLDWDRTCLNVKGFYGWKDIKWSFGNWPKRVREGQSDWIQDQFKKSFMIIWRYGSMFMLFLRLRIHFSSLGRCSISPFPSLLFQSQVGHFRRWV